MLLILREWLTPSATKDAASNDAERRLFESQRRRQGRWMIAASTACLAVILVLTADFIYARASSAPPSSRTVAPAADIIRVPIAEVQDGNLHVFTVNSGAQDFRFLIIKKPQGWALRSTLAASARGRLSPGRPKRRLPPLRVRHLHSYYRRGWRLQPGRASFSGRRLRHRRKRFLHHSRLHRGAQVMCLMSETRLIMPNLSFFCCY